MDTPDLPPESPILTIEGRRRDLGGFEVSRVLPFWQRRMVGPFIFFDHLGPLSFSPPVPRSADVRPHPHIGLATVTYLFAGEITHRDSTGVTQDIRPGEVNWMTAGSGITHSERFEGMRAAGGGPLEALQTWVALPDADEECPADFAHHPAADLPVLNDAGTTLHLIAGTAFGAVSPVRVRSPLHYLHATLRRDARLTLPREHTERAVYVLRGKLRLAGRDYTPGQMLVFGAAGTQAREPVLQALEDSEAMLLGGEPLGTRHIWWNFVSSRLERIEQAKADWTAGRIALPPHDSAEFIPLPQDPPRPQPEPLS